MLERSEHGSAVGRGRSAVRQGLRLGRGAVLNSNDLSARRPPPPRPPRVLTCQLPELAQARRVTGAYFVQGKGARHGFASLEDLWDE